MTSSRPLSPTRRARLAVVSSAAVTAMLLAGGCAKSSSSDTSSGSGGSATTKGGGQKVDAAGSKGATCTAKQYGAPKVDLKSATIGFSQSESTSNPFRATETSSITAEAKRLGIKLIQRNANANVPQQNTDIQDMIAQGAKAIIVAPENSDGLGPALTKAKAKHVPILTIDRTVKGTPCQDFIGFIGSNFAGQAKIAADDLAKAMGGKGEVAVLQGTSGNNVATDRTNGFNKQIAAKYPGVKIVASQPANFDQATGQKVMEQILQSHPNIKGVYAQNDTMALGAIQAMRSAGKVPGKDIKIVSIDGIEDAVKGVVSGQLVSDIETNPRFGPLAFQGLSDFFSGKGTHTTTIIADHHFTAANAKQALANGDVY